MVRKYPYVVDLRKDMTLPGLTVALKSMSMTEIARFIVYPELAYGEAGCPPRIRPNAKIMYVIQILQFINEAKLNTPPYMTSDERNNLPFQTIINESKKFRSDGNRFYQDSNYSLAIKKWRKAINMLEEYHVTTEEDGRVRCELIWMLYSNLAQGYLKLERPAQACSACKIGLKSAEENGSSSAKLFFRFAKAKLMLKDSVAALGLVNEALNIEPLNQETMQLRMEILREKGREEGEYKKMCIAMFSKKEKTHSGPSKGKPIRYVGSGISAGDDPEFQQQSDELKEMLRLERKYESGIHFDDFVPDLVYCSDAEL